MFSLLNLNLPISFEEECEPTKNSNKLGKLFNLSLDLSSDDSFESDCDDLFENDFADDPTYCDKLGPGQIKEYLYLGSETHASNLEQLRQFGITAVLNVASGCPNYFESDTDIIYYNLDLQDHCEEDISAVFAEAFRFIDNVKSQGGRVLVHCQAGVSRSATIVTAYLMQTYKLSMDEALRQVKEKRKCASPNFGFMLKLMNFHPQIISE